MYIRKIESVFQSWMDTPSHKPIVVKGVRQCGKTSSVVDFANKHFRHIVYLDFREHPDYKMFFTPNLHVDKDGKALSTEHLHAQQIISEPLRAH